MSEKKIKGSFIGGYSKKEVNQFISDMSLDFKRQSDEKNATIEFERSRAEKAALIGGFRYGINNH